MSSTKIDLPLAFIEPPEGAIGIPLASEKWFREVEEKTLGSLRKRFPHINFRVYRIRSPEEANEFVESERGGLGYVIIILNCIAGLVRPIFLSGKPVLAIAETYGGSGEFLLEYSRALSKGYPILGFATREPWGADVLGKVRLLEILHKLRHTKILFIVSPGEEYLLKLEYPLSIHLYSALRDLQSIAGITPIVLNAREFVSRYYDIVSDEDARRVADRWVREASQVCEQNFNEILKSAKMYLAMKKAVEDYGANAIAIDCIVLRNIRILEAWPCLGYLELWYDNVMPVCEADPYSALVIVLGKYLAGVNGFVVDVAIDSEREEVIYYHCYAPRNPHGDPSEKLPFTITSAHLGSKHASVSVKLPVNEIATAVGLIPEEKRLIIHTAKIVDLESSNYACSVKLVGKASIRSIIRNWPWKSGWHRVLFFGDLRNEFKELATLLNLKILEEDRQ